MTMKRVSLVLLAAFVASSTGLLLALHQHEAHGDHDSHHCDVCIALVYGTPAVVEQPQVTLDHLAIARAAPVLAGSTPLMRFARDAFASRAPPLA